MSWHKQAKKWKAQVGKTHDRKTEYLGLFATEAEAKARCDARRLELRVDPDASSDWIDRVKST